MKTLKLMAILFGSAILIMSCDKKGHNQEPPPPVVAIAPPVVVKAPTDIIPIQEAEDMYHRYGTDLAPSIEKSINTNADGKKISREDDGYAQATRSLSIDYKTLKQYLAYIEQEAKEAKTDISGLRIYFSKYQNDKNNGRATVFLNPLKEGGKKGLNDDYGFAIQTINGKKQAVPVGKMIKVPSNNTTEKSLIQESTSNGIKSLALNDFPWSPPPENDPDDFQ